ncbi:MAG: hypothetical protein D6780_02425, partial [Candidatus Dadabacteria bacterium]
MEKDKIRQDICNVSCNIKSLREKVISIQRARVIKRGNKKTMQKYIIYFLFFFLMLKAPVLAEELVNKQTRGGSKEVDRPGGETSSRYLPGEEVVRGGKRMRVWSTEGPVKVSNAPSPGTAAGDASNQPSKIGSKIGVILDSRLGS